MLYQQDALPEEVNVSAVAVVFLYWALENRDATAMNAEHIEKLVPKGFGFRMFVLLIRPFFCKFPCLLADVV